MPPLPWLLGGAAIAALLAFGGGYITGDADAANRYQVKIDKLQIDAAKELAKVREAWAAQSNAVAATLETNNGKARVLYRTITQQVDKIVERPVYRDGVCLDGDGVVLVNAALAGIAVAPSDPGVPDNGMPRSLGPE